MLPTRVDTVQTAKLMTGDRLVTSLVKVSVCRKPVRACLPDRASSSTAVHVSQPTVIVVKVFRKESKSKTRVEIVFDACPNKSRFAFVVVT